MNESEFRSKLDEIVEVASKLLIHSQHLEIQIEDLRSQVKRLDERLSYKERILVGWNEIGKYLGCTSRWALEMHRRNFDPLPTAKQCNVVVAHATALDAWKERQKDYRRCNISFDDDERSAKPRLVAREPSSTPS